MISEDFVITKMIEEYCHQQGAMVQEKYEQPITEKNAVQQAELLGQAEAFLKVQKFIQNYLKTRVADAENYNNWLNSA